MAIQILTSDVVDQINAGEVLERPANLVKELLENSLDAGATEIEIEFGEGGRSVAVIDNGSGMTYEDLQLCLRRHATSKILSSADLYKLSTFGFRGEAMASIAGVSDMTVVTRRAESSQGHRLDSKFGALMDPVKVAAPVGTEVRVRDLFANVPARLSFMKSEAAEHNQIRATIKAFALAREDAGFRVRSKGELLFHWPKGQSLRQRAAEILQNENLFLGSGELGSVKVDVAVSSPRDTQAVNRNLWFFVQGRWVQDRSLTAAVMEAYRNLLMHGEYPSAVIRIELPSEDVDANIHPTKAQVKFKDPQTVFRAVSRTIRSILEKQTQAMPVSSPVNIQEPTTRSLSFQAPEFEKINYQQKSMIAPGPQAALSQQAISLHQPIFEAETPKFRWRDLHVVGQAHLTYIVAQNADSLYLVDQHAAHERIVFERLMQSFKAQKMDIQNLLLPLAVDLPEMDIQALMTERQILETLGLTIDRMGPRTLVVQTIPSLTNENSVTEALKRAAYQLSEHGGGSVVHEMVGDLFATMACHSVVRAGQALSSEQMRELLQQMDEFPLSSFCPHGRPVYVRRRFTDVEREFGRIN